MADEGFKRKLTASLSADAVGYSRLMRDDEAATDRDIATHRVLISEILDCFTLSKIGTKKQKDYSDAPWIF